MFPQALSFIQVNFSGSSKRIAFSLYGTMIGFGSIVGQLLGGFLIQANLFQMGWRPIFLINLPIGILGGLAICTVIYVIIGAVLTGMVPYQQLGSAADPLAFALKATGMTNIAKIVALGAVFSMAAVLLVFQYGQPRIFFAMARDGLLPHWASKLHGKYRTPYITTILTGVFVALWSLIGDAGETYDLTNIGTLFAFALVCTGVIVLRYTDPDRPRPFRVPFVHFVGIVGAALCIFVMKGLPHLAWVRFGWWLVIGLALYVLYGYGHSTLRRHRPPVPVEPPPPIGR